MLVLIKKLPTKKIGKRNRVYGEYFCTECEKVIISRVDNPGCKCQRGAYKMEPFEKKLTSLKNWIVIETINKERIVTDKYATTKYCFLVKCKNCGIEVLRSREIVHDTICENCQGRPKGQTGFNIMLTEYKCNAETGSFSFDLTDEEFKNLTLLNCFWCGIEPMQVKKTRQEWGYYIHNGIDRVNSKIGYAINNCVSACFSCNQSRMNHNNREWFEWKKRDMDVAKYINLVNKFKAWCEYHKVNVL
jgi:hypothetical protein